MGILILTCIVSFHLSTMAEHGLVEILLSHSKFLSVNPKHFNPHISTGLSSYGTTSAKFFPLPPSPAFPSSKDLLKPLTLTWLRQHLTWTCHAPEHWCGLPLPQILSSFNRRFLLLCSLIATTLCLWVWNYYTNTSVKHSGGCVHGTC
jgi:hypothetical protein